MSAKSSQTKPAGEVERDRRRAAALRENLRRRKAQSRARDAATARGAEAAEARPAGQVPVRETEP